jgi:hypothetical protein
VLKEDLCLVNHALLCEVKKVIANIFMVKVGAGRLLGCHHHWLLLL